MTAIPDAANTQFLPLMFFLPERLFVRCPTLMRLPRNPHTILSNQALLDIVESDQFLDDMFNAASLLAFPHFGFKGWKEDYTGYHPAWLLSGTLSTWAYMLDKEVGWNLKMLLEHSVDKDIPFMPTEFVEHGMGLIVKKVIEKGNLQPVLDVVREMPCDEDFEPRNSNVRIDFLRKWYHTRVQTVQMISLEACLEDKEHGIYEIEDKSSSFEESVIAEDFCQRFKSRLSEKDMEILELRVEGYTYEKIADKLGYKNHSGVIKRIRAIEKEFVKYEDEQQ